ncbi:Endonuclease/exonuclease/phosphatase [Corchorus capsularis]|uniref:Endonuclease/exonuclease/phosphatase n=1 Tax=Corchorus capsularis TaxID=210143 RepID=A0A1R3GU85_COCAP|nr:Endonuclease/exonuclease/phosphatase [Corchorus capsularis]
MNPPNPPSPSPPPNPPLYPDPPNILNTPNPPNHLNPANIQPVPPNQPRIFFQRECSWTSSDESTHGSNDEADSRKGAMQPSPWLQRESNKIHFSRDELLPFRSEGEECVIGFLLNDRRFSTSLIQNYINNAWELVGTVTVMGREENRYLIHFDNEVDRRAAVMGNPWCCQGATFVVGNWMPNTALCEVRLARFPVWLQIWFLPFEYQQPLVAGRLASAAGDVIRVDWTRRRTRNIRFMRVRINISPYEPLTPGCTLDCYDDPAHNHFSYHMRAYLNRTSMRNTRTVIRQGQCDARANTTNGNASNDRPKPMQAGSRPTPSGLRRQALLRRIPPHENTPTVLAPQEGNRPAATSNLRGQRLVSLGGDQQTLHVEHTSPENTNQQQQPVAASQAQPLAPNEVTRTAIENIRNIVADETDDEIVARTIAFNREINDRIADLQDELNSFIPTNLPQVNYPREQIEDIIEEFDNTEQRVQRLHERVDQGVRNQSDIDDLAFAIVREQSRFEAVYEELVKQSGGTTFTNARLCTSGMDRPKSSRMGERRGEIVEATRRREAQFQLDLLIRNTSPDNWKFMGDSLQNFILTNPPCFDSEQMVAGQKAEGDHAHQQQLTELDAVANQIQPLPSTQIADSTLSAQQQQPQEQPAPPNNMPMSSFVCTINEADNVSVFVRDTSSPSDNENAEDTKATDKGKGKEKRKREQEEDVDSGPETGRCIRRRLQNLAVQEQNASRDEVVEGIRNKTSEDDASSKVAVPLTNVYNHVRNWGFDHFDGITCIYGNPDLQHRKEVWEKMCTISLEIPDGEPWLMWGDFNQVLKSSDKLSKASKLLQGAQNLWECLNRCKVVEVKARGLHFTWSNGRDVDHITWERLDRAFANTNWIQTFNEAILENLPITISDHSPMVLNLEKSPTFRHRAYRFEIMWTLHPGCKDTIVEAWNQDFPGSTPFKLTRKLKIVREKLKLWNKKIFGNLQRRKLEVQEELAKVQGYIGVFKGASGQGKGIEEGF